MTMYHIVCGMKGYIIWTPPPHKISNKTNLPITDFFYPSINSNMVNCLHSNYLQKSHTQAFISALAHLLWDPQVKLNIDLTNLLSRLQNNKSTTNQQIFLQVFKNVELGSIKSIKWVHNNNNANISVVYVPVNLIIIIYILNKTSLMPYSIPHGLKKLD